MKAQMFIVLVLSSVAGLAAAAPAPTSVAPGKYHCVIFLGTLQTVPGFTIAGNGTYRHDDGSNGRFAYDAAQSMITFTGGSLDKQAGHVEAGEKTGVVRLYNESRSRTVIDCDTPR